MVARIVVLFSTAVAFYGCQSESTVNVQSMDRRVVFDRKEAVFLVRGMGFSDVHWRDVLGKETRLRIKKELQYVHVLKGRGGFCVGTDGIVGFAKWPVGAVNLPEADFEVPQHLERMGALGKIVAHAGFGVTQAALDDNGRLLLTNAHVLSVRVEVVPHDVKNADLLSLQIFLDDNGVDRYVLVAGSTGGDRWLWSTRL